MAQNARNLLSFLCDSKKTPILKFQSVYCHLYLIRCIPIFHQYNQNTTHQLRSQHLYVSWFYQFSISSKTYSARLIPTHSDVRKTGIQILPLLFTSCVTSNTFISSLNVYFYFYKSDLAKLSAFHSFLSFGSAYNNPDLSFQSFSCFIWLPHVKMHCTDFLGPLLTPGFKRRRMSTNWVSQGLVSSGTTSSGKSFLQLWQKWAVHPQTLTLDHAFVDSPPNHCLRYPGKTFSPLRRPSTL